MGFLGQREKKEFREFREFKEQLPNLPNILNLFPRPPKKKSPQKGGFSFLLKLTYYLVKLLTFK